MRASPFVTSKPSLAQDHLQPESRLGDLCTTSTRQIELDDRQAREHRRHQQERDQHREDVDHRHEQ
jgi:hypothetical protein